LALSDHGSRARHDRVSAKRIGIRVSD